MNRTIKMMGALWVGLLILALAQGCAQLGIGQPGGIAGTGVGDGEVSDFEATVLNVGGEAAGVSGIGTKAQKIRPPSKPAAAEARQYPLLGEVTNHWDSKGTVTHPPYHFRIDPEYGSITGTYGQVKAPAQATIDPAVQAMIQQAVLAALQGQPVSVPAIGQPAPTPATATPPAGAQDHASPIHPAIQAVKPGT